MVDVFIGIVPSLIAIRGTTLTTEQAHGNSPVGLSPMCPDGSLVVRTPASAWRGVPGMVYCGRTGCSATRCLQPRWCRPRGAACVKAI